MININIGVLSVDSGLTVNFYPPDNGVPIVGVDSLEAIGDTDAHTVFKDINGPYSLYAKSATLDYVDFTNCHAVGPGIPFVDLHGINGGGNENIIFSSFPDQTTTGAFETKAQVNNIITNKGHSTK